MPKNIVICCDGTGNSFENSDQDSNVVKLYSCLEVNEKQRGYYHPGVGTMGNPDSPNRLAREWSRIKGLAFGAGLLDNVGDAYRFLMDTYADGDQIFLFGFSRGAFTARALASVLHVFGLLCAGNQGVIPYILNVYAKRSREAKHQRKSFDQDLAFQWQFSHTHEVKIHFCGIWDTVSSYGWIYDPVELPFLGRNPIIRTGRHAISIHERRCLYQDNLWGDELPDQDIRQVWFSGVHSDIGGSYKECESGLSKIALKWMLDEATKAGLHLQKQKVETVLGLLPDGPFEPGLPRYSPQDNNALKHESLHGLGWWLLEYLPHQDPHANGIGWSFPRGRRRTIPPNSRIHESVLASKYRPPDLPPHQVEPWNRY